MDSMNEVLELIAQGKDDMEANARENKRKSDRAKQRGNNWVAGYHLSASITYERCAQRLNAIINRAMEQSVATTIDQE